MGTAAIVEGVVEYYLYAARVLSVLYLFNLRGFGCGDGPCKLASDLAELRLMLAVIGRRAEFPWYEKRGLEF